MIQISRIGKNSLCKINSENILMSKLIGLPDGCLWILRKGIIKDDCPKILTGMPGCMEMSSTWTEKTAREAGFDLRTLTSCHSCLDMAGTGRTLKLLDMKNSLNSRKSCEGQHETSKQNSQNIFVQSQNRRTGAHHWLPAAGFLTLTAVGIRSTEKRKEVK